MPGAIADDIAGSIYENLRTKRKDIPPEILGHVRRRLTRGLWDKTLEFYRRYGIPGILRQVETLDTR